MTTYFVWTRDNEIFDAQVHSRCDVDILELTITQREGEVALAKAIVSQIELPPWDRRNVFISNNNMLIFSGRLVGLPLEIRNDLMSLEFSAEPMDAAQQLQGISSEINQTPYWDSCFVESTEQDNPAEWLEARSALFAWDRVTGKVCLSDLFEGRHRIDFTSEYYVDSLIVRLAETPISHISVNLTCEWVQKAEGEISLGSRLATAFPEGLINTLTPQTLQATWFHEGQKLGRSGYTILKSSLTLVNPWNTGILNLYPNLTPEFMSWEESSQVSKPMRARRFWMTAVLVLGWHYAQKRRERVCFTLNQTTQLDGKIRPLKRQLNLHLEQIASEKLGTFFLTYRGRQAIEHALERARAHLAVSARCLEVEITLPFEAGLFLSMDHSIRLVDSRIPGGEVNGKVIAYKLYHDGLQSFTWVRFVASIGKQANVISVPENKFYADQTYGDTCIPSYYQTVSGIIYENFLHQKPQIGIVEPESLAMNDILPEVVVSNGAQRQIQILENQQYPIQGNIKRILEDVPTIISLNLLSLKTMAVAEHRINVTILNSWVAPCQVNIMGEKNEI